MYSLRKNHKFDVQQRINEMLLEHKGCISLTAGRGPSRKNSELKQETLNCRGSHRTKLDLICSTNWNNSAQMITEWRQRKPESSRQQ